MLLYTVAVNFNASVDRMEMIYSGVVQYHIKFGFLILYLESGKKVYLAASNLEAFSVEVSHV